jgi:hypothetical protein
MKKPIQYGCSQELIAEDASPVGETLGQGNDEACLFLPTIIQLKKRATSLRFIGR